MARAMRRLALKYDDQDLLQRALKDEAVAQERVNQQIRSGLGLKGNA
jgi:hypothetical protein